MAMPPNTMAPFFFRFAAYWRCEAAAERLLRPERDVRPDAPRVRAEALRVAAADWPRDDRVRPEAEVRPEALPAERVRPDDGAGREDPPLRVFRGG